MIWVKGQITDEADLAVSVADRAFEHGLGLFETLRTWHRRPVLLPRHLARLRRSAEALGLPLDPGALPDADAVAHLMHAARLNSDVALRITLTGGRTAAEGSVLWMRAGALPPPNPRRGASLLLATVRVDWHDPLARHKTLNYWSRRLAHESSLAQGGDEALLATPDGRVWEGSRTSLFLVRGETLITPSLAGPVVPGVMRELVLERAADAGLKTVEADLDLRDVDGSDEVFLTNAVRGIIPVSRTPGRSLPAPGPYTERLWSRISSWLNQVEHEAGPGTAGGKPNQGGRPP